MTVLNTVWLARLRRISESLVVEIEGGESGSGKSLKSRATIAKEEILSAIIAEKVERLVAGTASDQERCLRIARWIAGNIANRNGKEKDELGWFAYRNGMCGSRAVLFVRMLSFLHIPARVFNLYNFEGPGAGHTCAQAYYDGKWHFFDVTYAGVFIRDGNVLSWEQIAAHPEQSLQHMVVFEQTLDRYGQLSEDTVHRRKVNNVDRMRLTYTQDKVRRGRDTAGFFQLPDVKTLYAPVDLGRIKEPVKIGRANRSLSDVNEDGIKLKISQCLGVSLGTAHDTFHTMWEFKGCKPGKTYVLRYHLYRATDAELKYWARGSKASVLSGSTFASTKRLAGKKPEIWEIRFRPDDGKSCSIQIGFDFRETGRLLHIDKIEILAAPGASG